ncbi:tetratricopeptide repeat protein [Borreliella garinii]|uniref:tetratricopeptide repeat protein n=1 Tax=Borreliella garinii TaxID=29519 RepID=UPI002B4BF799|nr:tetratricopeptide repeat protein [Borreliella garinii]WRM48256.1 tetratricopeptide repeat protein [Borreliella garinii]
MNFNRFLMLFFFNFSVLLGSDTTALGHYQKAHEYYLSKRYYDAIDELVEAIKINPNYYEAYKFIASIYYSLKIYTQAQFFIEKAYKMSNEDIEYKILYANILLKNNKIDQAKKIYSEVLVKQRNNIDALVGLASIFEQNGLFIAAANYYLSILDYSQNNYSAFEHLIDIYQRLGMHDKIRHLINKVRVNFLSFPDFHKRVAEFYISINNLGLAEKYALNYLALIESSYKDFGVVGAYRLLALVYLHEFKYEDAIESLQKAILVNKDSDELYYLLGYSYLKFGDIEKAILNLERAKNLKKDLEFYNIALEESFFASNFRNFLKNNSNAKISKHYENEGFKAFKSLDLNKALFSAKNAIDIWPDNDSARFLLSKIYKLMNLDIMAYEQLFYLVKQRNSTDSRILDFYDVVSFDVRKSLFYKYGYKNIADFNKLYDDRMVYRMAIFTQSENKFFGASDLILRYAERVLERNLNIEIVNYNFDYNKNRDYLINNFSEGFSYSRNNNLDLFLIFDFKADILKNTATLLVNVFSGKTGIKVGSFSYDVGGVNYLSNALNSFSKDFHDYLPKKGKILQIKNDDALVNLGQVNGVLKGDIFLILKEGALNGETRDSNFIVYKRSDILGEILIEDTSDYISRGTIKSSTFLKDYIQEGATVLVKR